MKTKQYNSSSSRDRWKYLVFISQFGVWIYVQYFFDEWQMKLQTNLQELIKRTPKVHTCHVNVLSPMIKIFQKLFAELWEIKRQTKLQDLIKRTSKVRVYHMNVFWSMIILFSKLCEPIRVWFWIAHKIN